MFDKDIHDILQKSRLNNDSKDIIGVLLFNKDMFVQYLGNKNDVEALYQTINCDPRHGSPLILNQGTLKERTFPAWHMAEKPFCWDQLNFKSTISEAMKSKFTCLLQGSETSQILDSIVKS